VSEDHTFHEADVVPVKYGRVCTTCHRLLPVKAFEHVRYRSNPKPGLANDDGTKLRQVQEWKECLDCTTAGKRERKEPPPSRMRRADLTRAVDEGRISPYRAYAPAGLQEKVVARERTLISRAARAHHKKMWAAPYKHALASLNHELARLRSVQQYLDKKPYPDEQQNAALLTFLSIYRSVIGIARVALEWGMRDETARADRAWVVKLREARSEHWQTNTTNERPVGRPPKTLPPAIRWASVCLPESRWADYLPEGELASLQTLYNALELRTRARRMRVVPLLLDPDRQYPLADPLRPYVHPYARAAAARGSDAQQAHEDATAWLRDRHAAMGAQLRASGAHRATGVDGADDLDRELAEL